MKLVKNHWYRTSGNQMFTKEDPCVYTDCGKTQAEHVESIGEWMEPHHWFLPSRRPSRCIQCGRHWRHSTHILISPKWRNLHGF